MDEDFGTDRKKKIRNRTLDDDAFTYGIPEVEAARNEAEKRGLVTSSCTYSAVGTDKYKHRKSPAFSLSSRYYYSPPHCTTPSPGSYRVDHKDIFTFPRSPYVYFTERRGGYITPISNGALYHTVPTEKYKYPSSPKPVLIGRH